MSPAATGPGLTAVLTEVLAAHAINILDIGPGGHP
jgi:predicted amino acid-binding ACT domain protein